MSAVAASLTVAIIIIIAIVAIVAPGCSSDRRMDKLGHSPRSAGAAGYEASPAGLVESSMHTPLHWIAGSWPGRLAVAARPRGGDWLDDEIAAWRRAGVDIVVSFLTPEEVTGLDLDGEHEACSAAGIEFVSFPVPDRGLPPAGREFGEFVRTTAGRLADGNNVILHCRQGIGRAAVGAICVLTSAGVGSEEAIRRVGTARGCAVPETEDQRRWVAAFAGGK